MKKSLKKLWTGLAATLTAVSSMVSADVYNCCEPACNVCPLPCCPTSCGRWSLEADLLYWTACEGGLTFGSSTCARSFGTSTSGSETSYHTKKKSPHSRWDVGFRVGIGYQAACDCWDGALVWTNFTTDQSASHHEAASGSHWFTPSWGAIPGTGTSSGNLLGGNLNNDGDFPVSRAHAHWKLRLNLIDLEFGREYCVNTCLSLRPFVGVRGASINEKYKLKYDATTLIGSTEVNGPFDRVHLTNDYEGAGVRGGLDTAFDIGCGLSLYGGVAASLLYGETEVKSREHLCVASASNISNEVEVRQKDKNCGCRAITDAEIGLRWQKMCCDKMVVFQIGWEHHFFFSQNQFEKFTNFNGTDNFATDRNPEVVRGDLSVQGLVVSGKVFF